MRRIDLGQRHHREIVADGRLPDLRGRPGTGDIHRRAAVDEILVRVAGSVHRRPGVAPRLGDFTPQRQRLHRRRTVEVCGLAIVAEQLATELFREGLEILHLPAIAMIRKVECLLHRAVALDDLQLGSQGHHVIPRLGRVLLRVQSSGTKLLVVDEQAHRIALIRQGVDLPIECSGSKAARGISGYKVRIGLGAKDGEVQRLQHALAVVELVVGGVIVHDVGAGAGGKGDRDLLIDVSRGCDGGIDRHIGTNLLVVFDHLLDVGGKGTVFVPPDLDGRLLRRDRVGSGDSGLCA